MAKEPTICVKCKHLLIRADRINPGEWYNYFCDAPGVAVREMDYVTGKSKLRRRYALDINKEGKCEFFEKNSERP